MTNKLKVSLRAYQDKITLKSFTNARLKKFGSKFVFAVFRYALILCLAYMILYPLLEMITASFTHPYDIGSTSSIWIPEDFTWDNFIVSWIILEYPRAVVYTLGSTLAVALFQMANAALAGYAFARLKFKGSNILFFLVVFTIIVPPSALMLPQYINFMNFDILGIFKLITGDSMNLLGKPAALFTLAVLGQGLNSGLFIYIFIQFFRGLPKELEEAAYVDGAGFLRTFLGIVLPSAKPGFVTVGVLSFVWNWNDTYFPRLFNPTDQYLGLRLSSLSALSGGASNVQTSIGSRISRIGSEIVRLDTGAYDAVIIKVCTLLIIVPLIIFFFSAQKQFVEGVERSGIVG